MKRTRVAGIIPMGKGIALMHRMGVVKREDIQEYYCFPGGGLEEGETPEKGTIREIKEELGIDVKIIKKLYELNSERFNQKELFYLCEYIGGEFGTGDGPEFNNDPKYIDSGKFIPKIIKFEDIESTILLPQEIKEKLVEDIKKGNIKSIEKTRSNKTKLYFDIGSSTIKLYQHKEELELIEEKSILFKNDFSEKGVSTENLEELMKFIKTVKNKHNLNITNTKIYATGIWRKISEEQLSEIKKMFQKINLEFNVISHEEENNYFEKAMIGNYNKKRIMMVNMGGKTTEIVVFNDNKVENKVNLNVGVADILIKFPNINDLNSNIKQEEIIDFVFELLKDENIDFNCDIAIHTGGELRFQKLVEYNLKENIFFDDGIHKLYVSYEDFDKKNKELLYNVTLGELHSLMPENPKWMDGAKAGIMLGQAIFKKANIKTIIPSDLNLIHGVIKQKSEK